MQASLSTVTLEIADNGVSQKVNILYMAKVNNISHFEGLNGLLIIGMYIYKVDNYFELVSRQGYS